MTNFQIIVDVMFATYLIHFISGFLNSSLEMWPKMRIVADIIVGIILLFLVGLASS